MLKRGSALKLILLLYILSSYSPAQWVNNPSVNTPLISAITDPLNLVSVEDLNGGAFIFWEENRTGFQNEIYFLHIDGNGKVNFRVDGKKVSEGSEMKQIPIASPITPGTAVVIWKSFSGNDKGNLFAQKVTERGQQLWSPYGLKLTNTIDEIVHYAVDTDNFGNTFVVYTEKEGSSHDLHIQKINSSGILAYDIRNKPLVVSETIKSLASVTADNSGGAFLVWLETENHKSRILALHLDNSGRSTWGKNPVNISGSAGNITNYSVNELTGSIHVAWQVHSKEKKIYHQLVNKEGRLMWQTDGKTASRLNGDQFNPQVLTSDSSIILSWTHEKNNDRDVYIQKYNFSGEPLWGKDGIPVITLAQDQFGQKLVTDGKGGAIVTWIDRRDEKKYENLFSQRINRSGMLVWDTLAIPVASHPGSVKSYPSVISDSRGGIIAIFKDKRDNHTGIFAQKVFNTGTYISQIVGFQTEIEGDSVKISWYSANETGPTIYEIERSGSSDTTAGWEVINIMVSDGESTAKKFEFNDKPDETGSIYYRLIQTDDKGNIQPSDISKVNYFFGATDFSLAQNSPNPFSDTTVIKFYLPKEMAISIEFFDSHVEKISEIKDRYLAGENEIVFDASGLPQGIYFYRFEAGEFVDVKKMVVVN